MIFNMSGGGQQLNFKVVGGTGAPDAPKENMIWVNTDTEISGWIFSVEEPSPPEEGLVWIALSTNSAAAFNALKKNGIYVCPRSAKQYISGAWADVTAKSYQGGSWVEWYTWLYNAGNEFSDLTGSWTGDGYSFKNSGVTKNEDSITLASVFGEYKSNIGTANKINLQGKRYLKATGYALAESKATLLVLNSKDIYDIAAQAYFLTAETEISIPLDALQGEYYIACVSAYTTAYIKSVKLE